MSKTSDKNCWKTKVCLKNEKVFKDTFSSSVHSGSYSNTSYSKTFFFHFITYKNMAILENLNLNVIKKLMIPCVCAMCMDVFIDLIIMGISKN